IGVTVRRYRRCLEELAEEELRTAELRTAADPEETAALLTAALLGGGRTRAAGEALAEALGAHSALRLRDGGSRLLGTYLDRVLSTERCRRLAPLDGLEITPQHQVELIAALSVLQKER
ncbi:ATP-binding protein, partial [Streptomyces sp. H27-D2]|nr:ATP-binding protein [Streptomyces sp. H27-D2]